LHLSVLLGRTAIFGHEEDDVHQDSATASCPFGEGIHGRDETTRQLHTCLIGKVVEYISDILEG